MKKLLIPFVFAILLPNAAFAQITVPNTFTAGTTILSAQVNANFAKLSDALNRTGGTMTGTLTSQAITPGTTATYGLGDTTHRYTTGWFSGIVTAGTFSGSGASLTSIPVANLLVAAQAANDLIYASSASAWTRLANGTTGQILTATTASAPTWASPKIATYTATLANVQSTAVETTIVSFDVPANTWADGDTIVVYMDFLMKNNKGTDGIATLKVNAGAGAQVTVGTPTFTNNVTEYKTVRLLYLTRVGNDVWIPAAGASNFVLSITPDSGPASISTPTNFTSTVTISLKATLDASDATFYIKPQAARIFKLAQ